MVAVQLITILQAVSILITQAIHIHQTAGQDIQAIHTALVVNHHHIQHTAIHQAVKSTVIHQVVVKQHIQNINILPHVASISILVLKRNRVDVTKKKQPRRVQAILVIIMLLLKKRIIIHMEHAQLVIDHCQSNQMAMEAIITNVLAHLQKLYGKPLVVMNKMNGHVKICR
jgi:hypothetical protein